MRISKMIAISAALVFATAGHLRAQQHDTSVARDSPRPEIAILGTMQEGADLRIRVEVRNFTMGGEEYTKLAADPTKMNPEHYGEEKQRPNFGHVHAYL